MNKYRVVLTKSYLVDISANNEEEALRYCEMFTGDSKDISSPKERDNFNFEIKSIDCTVNESFSCEEMVII